MIVRHHEKGWEIISQYAHGLLAGKIASQLKEDLMPNNWVDVLTGIVEHDDHLPDYDEQDYLTDKGTPKDFTMEGGSDKDALVHAERVYANAMQKSQLIALLVGRHLKFLYQSMAENYAPMKDFLADIGKLGKGQRKLYGLSKKEENALYDIMLFCDRCSLILCQDEVPQVGRKLEINQTIENQTYFIHSVKDDVLTIEPWPFKEKTIDLDLEYRVLENVKFKNNVELKEAIEDAEVVLRTFTLLDKN